MRGLLSSLQDIAFPKRCLFCDQPPRDNLICHSCLEKIHFISPPFCLLCGNPFKSHEGKSHICGECSVKKRPYYWARSILAYDNTTAGAVHRFKYVPDTSYASGLGRLMSDMELPVRPDLIVPVPLHKNRLRERGFNQSLVLAREIGKRIKVPVRSDILKKVKDTEHQVNLPAKERRKNVKGAFVAANVPPGCTILLVDDVYTTGTTVSECSKVLKKSGAGRVMVLTLARVIH